MAETLAYHAAEHCLESLFIAIIVIPHALQGAANSHLAAGNGNGSVEKIQIGQLAIDTVVEHVKLVEAMTPRASGILNSNSSLKSSALERKSFDFPGVVGVVIGINPGLRACSGVAGNEYYYVLGPERPSCAVRLERRCDGVIVDAYS